MNVQGAYTALVTPFTENHELDLPSFKNLIHFQVEEGIEGITLLGTTGESPTITDEERTLLITTAKHELKGNIPLMVGCGTNCTTKTIELAKEAEALGADSLLLVTPYYNRPTQEGIFQHFKVVAESVTIPCCIYNIASRTGQNIETATLERLASIPHIVSIKEASGNIFQMTDVLQTIAHKNPSFSVLSGDDSLTLPLMALGGHGIISVISNLFPKMVQQLVSSIECGDIEKARKLFFELKPYVQMAFIETNPVPIKRMLEMAGVITTSSVRMPLVPLLPHNDAKLKELMNKASSYGKKSAVCCP